MNEHSRQALVGDIGGTYISLAIADIDELTVSHFALLSSGDFNDPMQAVERYLKSIPRVPDKASFAVWGTGGPDGIRMSHRPWTVTRKGVQAVTGAEHVTLVNDLEALALSLPHLTDYELIPISKGRPKPYATRAVIAAGTGLNVAALVRSGERWVPVRGLGGQVAFPAVRKDEFDARGVFPVDQPVTAEMVFSGKGLVALYEGLARRESAKAVAVLTPEQITKVGLSREDQIAAEAVDLMAAWLARFAADVALLFGAEGGVFLAGGLSAGVVPAYADGRFRAELCDHGEARAYLEEIPVNVIKMGADAGLRGAAVALAEGLAAAPPARRLVQRASR